MSTSTQPITFLDLYTWLMNRVRQDTSQTAILAQAKGAICTALYDMHLGMGEKFLWCERNARLTTQAPYAIGACTISQGSTSLIGSGTAWDTNNSFSVKNVRAGGKIVINGTDTVYEVLAVLSDTSLTLASPYVDDDVSGGAYIYFEDEYALASDFLRPLDIQRFSSAQDIPLIGRREFRLRYPRNDVTGKPRVATILDKAPSGSTVPIRHVAFYQPPDDYYSIPYAYVTSNLVVSSAGAPQANFSADTDEPIVPVQYRHAIGYHALYHWYRDKKDDTRSQEAKAEYSDIILRIEGDTEIGGNRMSIRPRVSGYRAAARQPWNRRSAYSRYVTGSAFDQGRE